MSQSVTETDDTVQTTFPVKSYKNENTLRRLYIEEGLSTYDLADRFDVTPPTIRSRLSRELD